MNRAAGPPVRSPMLSSIRRLLTSYESRPAERSSAERSSVEREALSFMRRVIETSAHAHRRDHYEPGHFTVGGFVVDRERRRLLLVHHVAFGRWLQPGGHLEPDDRDPATAARREVIEETGVRDLRAVHEGLFDVDVHEIPPTAMEPAHVHLDLRFLFETEQVALAGVDGQPARWVPVDEAALSTADASVRRAVEKLRGTAR